MAGRSSTSASKHPAASDRYAREGVDLSLSTLVDQVGACTAALIPLYLLIEAHVLAAERLHGDDKTVPVLAKTKTDTGWIWTYVRDDQPFFGPAPPAAIFHYSRDRRGEHPVSRLCSWRGIFHADACAGYNALFPADRLPAPLIRALCWSHARRYFFKLADVAARSRSAAKTPSSRRWQSRRSAVSTRSSASSAPSTADRHSSVSPFGRSSEHRLLPTWKNGCATAGRSYRRTAI